MSDFDLRAVIRDVLDEGGCDTFREYAVRVIGRVPPKELKNALMACLPELVREIDHSRKPVVPVHSAGGHASSKVAAIAQAWSLFLARHITTDVGTQIRLAEATEEQVRFYVGLLRVKAREVNDQASKFEQIADLMCQHKAATVGQLPGNIGERLVRTAA